MEDGRPRPSCRGLRKTGGDARPPQRQFQQGGRIGPISERKRSRHLRPRSRARSVCRISRRKVWRLAAHCAFGARCDHAARRASSAAALAMDTARGRVRPAGSIDCLRRADRKTLSRPDLRIVSRLPDRNCRSLRWSDSEKRIGGIVGEVKSAALGRRLSALYALVILRVCDFFDVVKNRGCKQNSYDDKLVINSKKSQTLSAACSSRKREEQQVEGLL